jgi:ribosomal protein S18 acetylase RimI-like enzyme
MDAAVESFERTVVEAWPAAETVQLAGWLLRASGGPTHRGNSVSTLGATGAHSIEDRLDLVEGWYRERQKRPMLQVGPCATPAGLEDVLKERGYKVEGEAVLCTGTPTEVNEHCANRLETIVEYEAHTAWLELCGRASRFAATYDVFTGFLDRLGDRARFVSTRDEAGHTLATCLAVASPGEGRLGIYAMFTRSDARRRGAARALLGAAAKAAMVENLSELYLQVETDNAAARALYAGTGFYDLFSYRYWALQA